MSARTEASPLTEGQPRTRRRRPVVFHMFPREALEFARANGMDARAICGRWINPNATAAYDAATGTTTDGRRVCGNCTRIARARWSAM